jgi:epoxyqueuosine reductase
MKASPVLDNNLLKELGVLDWGYTEDSIPHSLAHFESWTENSQHNPLQYLNDHRKDLRRDLKLVFPEFQSALVFLFSYQEAKKWMLEQNLHSVAAYTLGFEGEDYHRAIKEKLNKIVTSLAIPDLKVFHSLDAQPILERDLAYRAGLGWFGKNSMMINQKEGSYFIIGSLLLNQQLPITSGAIDVDHCGQCTACADACPTNAINVTTRTIEASQCISTFTIEIFKAAEAPDGFEKSRGEIFGCDICQDVCPWNRKPLARVIGKLKLKESLSFVTEWFFEWPKEKLYQFIANETNRGFRKKLFGTPFDRPGKEGWLKNLISNSSRNDLSKKNKDEE